VSNWKAGYQNGMVEGQIEKGIGGTQNSIDRENGYETDVERCSGHLTDCNKIVESH